MPTGSNYVPYQAKTINAIYVIISFTKHFFLFFQHCQDAPLLAIVAIGFRTPPYYSVVRLETMKQENFAYIQVFEEWKKS
jgi:hypothetical protein